MTLRKTLSIAIAVAAIGCFTVSNTLVAQTAPIVTYTASGTFASTPVSGDDTLKLAGEPFSVSISVSAASEPYKHGSNWGAYNKLKLTGVVHSGLLGAEPVNIASSESTIIQALDPGQYDQFTMEAPVKVVGISLTIEAVIIMPNNTIPNPHIQPFAEVSLVPANATVTYSDSTASTVLAIQTGTLTAKTQSGSPAEPAVTLHSSGIRALTTHADGTASERELGAAPIDLGTSTDAVTLKFYASGLSGASEVHVQIGGEEAPVYYAGASGYFPGMDEVMVRVPRSLAGRGATDVTLTADGKTAGPVQVSIQ